MDTGTTGSRQDKAHQQACAKRETRSAYNRAYYQAHKAAKRAYNRQYQQLHRTERNAKRRLRYRHNPEPFQRATRQWALTHRARRRAMQQAWYLRNRERVLAKHRTYYQAHQEDAQPAGQSVLCSAPDSSTGTAAPLLPAKESGEMTRTM